MAEQINDSRSYVSTTDTEELNRRRTKEIYHRRKQHMLQRMNEHNSIESTDADSRNSPTPSITSSHCSELNFSNDDDLGTPDSPTRVPTHQQHATKKKHAEESDTLDMGDYELRIRPASAFWVLKDGLTMAEKIILYRNWKYQVGARRIAESQRTNEDVRLPPIENNQFVSRSRTTSPEELHGSHRRLSVVYSGKDEENVHEVVHGNHTASDHHIISREARNSQHENFVSTDRLDEEHNENSISSTDQGFLRPRAVSNTERTAEKENNHHETTLQEHNQAIILSEVSDIDETVSVKNNKQSDFNTVQNISEEETESSKTVNETSNDNSEMHEATLHESELNEDSVREEHVSTSSVTKESTSKQDTVKNNKQVETKERVAKDSKSEHSETEKVTEIEKSQEDSTTAELNAENIQDSSEQRSNDKTTVKQNKKVNKKQLSQKKEKVAEDENPIISRLDKIVDKDLRSFQNPGNDQSEDEDEVDEQTMNDLLYGKQAEELNNFLNS